MSAARAARGRRLAGAGAAVLVAVVLWLRLAGPSDGHEVAALGPAPGEPTVAGSFSM